MPSCHEKLFTTSQSAYAATSVVDAKDVTRGFPVNAYLQNQNVEKFSHEVVIDVDFYAMYHYWVGTQSTKLLLSLLMERVSEANE